MEREVCKVVIEYPEKFVGEIEKITLISMPCFYLCPPEGGIETEQKLTINASGKVTYTSKEWTTPIPNPYSEGRWKKATIEKEIAKELLNVIIEPFRDCSVETMCTDVGSWVMVARNSNGEEFKYEGCLFPESFEKAEETSYFVRNTLQMPDLYVFDGQHGYDNTKYIYLSVEFTVGGKTYYYQTTDKSIEIGDQVVVPVGRTEEKIVTVVDIEEFSEDEVPMPLSRVKSIIEKFSIPDKVWCPICNKHLTPNECSLIELCAEGLGPKSGYPEIIEPDLLSERAEICLSCRYHTPSKTQFNRNDIVEAHKYSMNNMPALSKDKKCGCFYCLEIFDPQEIDEYIEDEPADQEGTAICPYCSIDSIIPESAGYPLTKEFLSKMYKYWFDSGSGIAFKTPFGFVRLLLDGKEAIYSHRSVDIQSKYPDVDGCHYLTFEFVPDGKSHKLQFVLDNGNNKGTFESDELLETVSFEENGGKITLGCTASFGNPEDYNLDYDGTHISNGFEILITPHTVKKVFEFAVAWIDDLNGKDANQTWFSADPFVIKKELG